MGFFGRTSKTSGCVRIGALATAAVLALACHYFDDDDSGSSFVSPSQFEGSWQGTLRYANGDPSADLVMKMGAESEIASVSIDTVDQGLTGTVEFSDPNPIEEFARFYDFEFVDGSGAVQTLGSFYIDDRFQHGLLIYDNGDFAVLEKSVVGRPAGGYAYEDLAEKMTPTRVLGVYVRWIVMSSIDEVGNWEIRTWPVFDPTADPPDLPPDWPYYEGMIGGDVVPLPRPPFQDGEKTLINGIPFSGDFTGFDPMGIWEGFDAPGDTEPLIAIMSFDKEFVGTMECEPSGFPECVFSLWSPLLPMKEIP